MAPHGSALYTTIPGRRDRGGTWGWPKLEAASPSPAASELGASTACAPSALGPIEGRKQLRSRGPLPQNSPLLQGVRRGLARVPG